MVPHLDAVLDILERYHPVPHLMRALPWGEEVLEDLHHAVAEFGVEALEDQMGVGFRDGAAGGIGDVGSEDDVV